MLGFGRVRPFVLPNPDGTLASEDMYQLIYLYPGITLDGGAPVEAGSENHFFRRSRAGG